MIKAINQNPRTTDTIVFDILTTNNGCPAEPYRIKNITISYIERSFLSVNFGTYDKATVSDDLILKFQVANQAACDNPSDANLAKAIKAKSELDRATQTSTFYYKDAVVVFSDDEPELELVSLGHYIFTWRPEGIREGDYFISWTWLPLVAGDSLTDIKVFTVFSDPREVVTIPTHLTPDDKYEVLLERYLPDMYKQYLGDTDITPDVTDKFNKAIALGFKALEDFANQLIDLFDANAIHEALLVYLSNLFNLRLKSSDPTLWRRQIKEAVPLFKRKGTLGGLKDAFSQAGMSLNKFTRLWQVVSPYTYVESFNVKEPSFLLTHIVLNPLKLWLNNQEISVDNVIFEEDSCGFVSRMVWVGDEKSSPFNLYEGDWLRIQYQYQEITQQAIEDYIQTLSLADQREESLAPPLKNWNVRVIAEDDALFNVIVPVFHPFHEDVIFGQVRTEFPFSENIYNMEEYNGSTRNSTDPCLIDKNFLDPCSGGLSSKFSAEVAVEALADDRIAEIRDIFREYLPFHAVIHTLTFTGEVNEFMLPPVEDIEAIITINYEEFMLSGQANAFFHRVMEEPELRTSLTDSLEVVSLDAGTIFNDYVVLIAPEVEFGGLMPNHLVEVLAPSLNSGNYTIDRTGKVTSVVLEPLIQSMFTFRVSNITYSTSVAIITQNNVYKLSDAFVDLAVTNIWVVVIDDVTYLIDRAEGNDIYLLGNPPVGSIDYVLMNGVVNVREGTGVISVQNRALVDLNDSNIILEEFVRYGDLLVYDDVEYRVIGLVDDKVLISGYSDGDAAGVNVAVRRRLIDRAYGYFGYVGLTLVTGTNYELSLGIVNGTNPPLDITDNNLFKENFLVQIGSDLYKIAEINGTTITLAGLPIEATTTGTSVDFSIVKFTKTSVELSGVEFIDGVDRRGSDTVVMIITGDDILHALAAAESGGDVTGQQEEITFTIERR